MRRTVPILLVLALAGSGPASAPAKPRQTPPQVVVATFLVSGRGYGHGVGMSQYGALGMAREGKTYAEILAHYYPGTELKPLKVANVRVLLVEGAKRIVVSSEQPFRVREPDGTTTPLPAGEVETTAPLAGKRVFLPGKAPLAVGGRPYRGRIEVSQTADGKLIAVDILGIEPYLWGVVPGEMPHDWPEAALEAQAVAARSYAASHLLEGKPYDLYADVRSQVYGGIAYETPETTAAVQATRSQALFFDGEVASTLFHSSSGGRTANAGDVFAEPAPYLVSVPDPWDAVSPWHRWGPVAISAAKAKKGLKLPALPLDMRVVSAWAGRARTIAVTTARGETRVSGGDLRFALGLRSTWIRIGVLSLARPVAPVVYGGAVTLAGRARGVAGVRLEALAEDGTWAPTGAPPAPKPDGSFNVLLRPKATMQLRLAAGKTIGPTLRVPVAPRVRLEPTGGTVRPLSLAGASVDVQRLEGADWVSAAVATVDEQGAFTLAAPLAPGTYRAVVAPAAGLVQGVSAPLEVPAQ